MLYHHDVSYQHYLNAQRQRLVTAQQAAARLREQQQRDEQLRREAALATNSVCGIDTGSGGGGNSGGGSAGLSAEDALLLAYKNDTRNGLTIEDVLRLVCHCYIFILSIQICSNHPALFAFILDFTTFCV